MTNRSPDIAGYCPFGCGQTLSRSDDGYVICGYGPCPHPDAVARLLEDQETEHVVVFGPDVFTTLHPLRERLSDALMRCALHEWIAARDLPFPPGRYRVVERPGGASWTFQPTDAACPDSTTPPR